MCFLHAHAHIDHSGALPLLVKNGFDGTVYTTPATRDLLAVMLADAAMIQEQDARYINRAIERDGAPMDPVEPLYDVEDVTLALTELDARKGRGLSSLVVRRARRQLMTGGFGFFAPRLVFCA